MTRVFAVLVACALWASCAVALYEDEVGVTNWASKNIGRVTSAHFTGGSGRHAPGA